MATANNTSLPEEQWKPIPGWEGFYSASDHGRIRSESRIVESKRGPVRYRRRYLTLNKQLTGYRSVGLCRSGYTQINLVHRLVMLAFVGPCPENMEVCHGNGIRDDNRLSNLSYGTRSKNTLDQVDHGMHNNASKTHCKRGHELSHPNLALWHFERGSRRCLACARTYSYVGGNPDLKPHFKAIADSYYADIMRDAA